MNNTNTYAYKVALKAAEKVNSLGYKLRGPYKFEEALALENDIEGYTGPYPDENAEFGKEWWFAHSARTYNWHMFEDPWE